MTVLGINPTEVFKVLRSLFLLLRKKHSSQGHQMHRQLGDQGVPEPPGRDLGYKREDNTERGSKRSCTGQDKMGYERRLVIRPTVRPSEFSSSVFHHIRIFTPLGTCLFKHHPNRNGRQD